MSQTSLPRLKNSLIFVSTMWGTSPMVIIIAMLAIAPLLPTPPGGVQAEFGWGVFSHWDSLHYQQIATTGYDVQKGSFGYNVAFFPFFPLAIRALMNLGLPFENVP